MVDLLDKNKPLLERMQKVAEAGSRVGPVNEELLSPTRAMIDGRETILAGTNNYMGVTFEKSCIEAGQRALAEHGTGTTGSRIANGSYAIHEELEQRACRLSGHEALHRVFNGLPGQPGHDGGPGRAQGHHLPGCGQSLLNL